MLCIKLSWYFLEDSKIYFWFKYSLVSYSFNSLFSLDRSSFYFPIESALCSNSAPSDNSKDLWEIDSSFAYKMVTLMNCCSNSCFASLTTCHFCKASLILQPKWIIRQWRYSYLEFRWRNSWAAGRAAFKRSTTVKIFSWGQMISPITRLALFSNFGNLPSLLRTWNRSVLLIWYFPSEIRGILGDYDPRSFQRGPK